MILLLLSWVYILFTTINLGFFLDKILKLKVQNLTFLSILGLFSTTIMASFWAIFGRINFEFHLALLFLNCALFLSHKKAIISIYKNSFLELKSLDKTLKILLGLIALLIVAQCASIPFIIDNESYYIQTIKWINEYGFVKGLGNLHIYLGQTSGWHVLQSAFNLSFIYPNFNDLSGFCLLLGNIFSIQKLDNYFKTKNKTDLVIGLFPLSNILLFQFISAPSPDLPIYVFTFIICSFFLDNYRKISSETFNWISILVLFSLYIKTTSIALSLIPILILFQNYKNLKIYKITGLALVILFLFIAKNLIITGYPLFPITKNFGLTFDYQIPEKIAAYYYDLTKHFGYSLSKSKFQEMSFPEIFMHWLNLPKLHGFFNKIIIVLIILSPIVIYKFYNKAKFWVLYAVMVLQFILLFMSSPQYRFFMNFILIFSFLLLSLILNKKQIILISFSAFTLLLTILVFTPLNFSLLTKNKHTLESSNFSFKNFVFPYTDTKYDTAFELLKNENLDYYNPTNIDFFWGTGDGPLPCIRKKQLDYFEKKYQVKPQMRSDTIKDGFYAKDTSKK